jgi:DNA-binding MarR family transcriptional regulator
MADRDQCEELAHQLRGTFAVSREIGRRMPPQTPLAAVAVLSTLDRHGELRISALTELLAVDLSVTSRHVAYCVDRGWIERAPDPLDGRSRLLRLTPGGGAVLRASSQRAAEVLAEHLADWPDDDVAQLSALLARLRGSFGDCRPRTHAAHPGTRGSAAPGPADTPRAPRASRTPRISRAHAG